MSVLKVNGELDNRTIWRLWSKTHARPIYRTLNTRAAVQLRASERMRHIAEQLGPDRRDCVEERNLELTGYV